MVVRWTAMSSRRLLSGSTAEDVAVSVAFLLGPAGSLTGDQRSLSGFLEMMRAGGEDYVVFYQYVMNIFDVLLLDTSRKAPCPR